MKVTLSPKGVENQASLIREIRKEYEVPFGNFRQNNGKWSWHIYIRIVRKGYITDICKDNLYPNVVISKPDLTKNIKMLDDNIYRYFF